MSVQGRAHDASNLGLPDTSGQVAGVCAIRPHPPGEGHPALYLCTRPQKYGENQS